MLHKESPLLCKYADAKDADTIIPFNNLLFESTADDIDKYAFLLFWQHSKHLTAGKMKTYIAVLQPWIFTECLQQLCTSSAKIVCSWSQYLGPNAEFGRCSAHYYILQDAEVSNNELSPLAHNRKQIALGLTETKNERVGNISRSLRKKRK